MGNDQSNMKGLEIDKKAIEVTDFWILYLAKLPLGENQSENQELTIFQGDNISSSSDTNLWGTKLGPLEKATKNYMIYRHPQILKYFTSFAKGSTFNLATEKCRPLSLVIGTQSDIEICLGLKSVLTAMVFLSEQAGMRHLNICSSSIYVTSEGQWKLGGFEYLFKSTEVNRPLLEKSKSFRYNGAIDSDEGKSNGAGLEQYAFGVLCDEILGRLNESETPFLKEFKTYCKTILKHKDPTARPKLSAILLHSYFNHDFISIHSFLSELPLKGQVEKQNFFNELIQRLRIFDENIVGSQLCNALLSRIVMIDVNAQKSVLPFLLRPRTADEFDNDDDSNSKNLLSTLAYKKHIIPKLKQVFCVRDTQIRMILLEYFGDYMNLFSREDLEDNILPQLLLGIKDTNDSLVSTTLRCLAELVTILGASVVIGKNRTKIFSDGFPQGPPEILKHWSEARSITPVLSAVEGNSNSPLGMEISNISDSYASVDGNLMPERLSPDGGEDFKPSDDDETWADWEEETNPPDNNTEVPLNNEIIHDELQITRSNSIVSASNSNEALSKKNKIIPDITELDIKNQKITAKTAEEVDFFKDMEPIIQKTSVVVALEPTKSTSTSRFDIKMPEGELNDGDDFWGDTSENEF